MLAGPLGRAAVCGASGAGRRRLGPPWWCELLMACLLANLVGGLPVCPPPGPSVPCVWFLPGPTAPTPSHCRPRWCEPSRPAPPSIGPPASRWWSCATRLGPDQGGGVTLSASTVGAPRCRTRRREKSCCDLCDKGGSELGVASAGPLAQFGHRWCVSLPHLWPSLLEAVQDPRTDASLPTSWCDYACGLARHGVFVIVHVPSLCMVQHSGVDGLHLYLFDVVHLTCVLRAQRRGQLVCMMQRGFTKFELLSQPLCRAMPLSSSSIWYNTIDGTRQYHMAHPVSGCRQACSAMMMPKAIGDLEYSTSGLPICALFHHDSSTLHEWFLPNRPSVAVCEHGPLARCSASRA